jgi:DNA-binding NarL/FixJ family response regulator
MGPSILLQIDFSDPNTRWVVLGFAAFALVYITFIRPLRKKGRKDPLDKPPGASVFSQQRAVEREMSNLLVELSEMARQMTAQLDTRAAKLELLIKEADDRIATLKRAAAGITTVPPDEKSVEPSPTFSDPPADDPPAAPAPPDPRHVAVYELADQGCSIQEIAHELGRPTGEVELILALRAGA